MTKFPRIVSTSSPQPAPRVAQMSHPNPFEGRGRGHVAHRRAQGRGRGHAAHRRAHGWVVEPVAYRRDFLPRWGALIRDLFRTREDVASAFGVTFQTACNWWDGSNRPSGDKVALAALTWPEDFARHMGA